jgi:AcrR family transcriptional regulator
MSATSPRRTRSGALLPPEDKLPSYLGQAIEAGTIVDRQEATVGRMRGRVLLASIALFAERGYENCSVRSIAATVGLKAPTLYNYFPSKEALLIEAIEFGMNDFFSYVLDGIDAPAPQQKLHEIARRHVSYKIHHRVIARANDRLIDPQFGRMFLPKKYQKAFTKRLDDYRYLIRGLVETCGSFDGRIDPMIATLAIMNQWDRAAYWYDPKGPIPVEDVIGQMMLLTARILGLPPTMEQHTQVRS